MAEIKLELRSLIESNWGTSETHLVRSKGIKNTLRRHARRIVDTHSLRVRKRYILFRTAHVRSFTLSSAHPDVCTKTLSTTNFSIFGIYEVTFGISGVSEKIGIILGISGYLAGMCLSMSAFGIDAIEVLVVGVSKVPALTATLDS